MRDISIENGRALVGDLVAEATLHIHDGRIAAVSTDAARSALRLDARGLVWRHGAWLPRDKKHNAPPAAGGALLIGRAEVQANLCETFFVTV